MRSQRSGLTRCRFETAELDAWIGEVAGLDDEPIGGDLADFDCRNNRLAARRWQRTASSRQWPRAAAR